MKHEAKLIEEIMLNDMSTRQLAEHYIDPEAIQRDYTMLLAINIPEIDYELDVFSFICLLAETNSMSPREKAALLNHLDELTEEQANSLIDIFCEEIEKKMELAAQMASSSPINRY